ncbi:rho guanine nucleotide exchange factor 15 [Monodelphis domestica]|uniref:Rho guanine nucleotide exchange factor 15 n=1 Tax=Monodelphis domestica TaxID=13616 RepID=F7DQM9_MONDO|nr:rho guanine nucleotide exchange factor 15 [Monodelphis domestica]
MMSAHSLPPATPPSQKPPRVIRPQPPSRLRINSPPGSLFNGPSHQEAAKPPTSPDPLVLTSLSPLCDSLPTSTKSLIFPSTPSPKSSSFSLTLPDSSSSPPSPHILGPGLPKLLPPFPAPRTNSSPEPISPSQSSSPKFGSLPHHPSASGTVRRLAGKFEPGSTVGDQVGEAPFPDPQGGVDENGERKDCHDPVARSGPQENGCLDTPLSCPPCCPCLCHLAHPSLELKWVSVGDSEEAPRAPPRCPSRSLSSPTSNKSTSVVLTSYRSMVEHKVLPPLKPPKPAWARKEVTCPEHTPQTNSTVLPKDGTHPGESLEECPKTLVERDQELQALNEQDWGLPLQDEPLYQTAVLAEELWGVGKDGKLLPTNLGEPSEPRNTLWQELPTVRESGLLKTLSPEERRMQESLFEVVTSEASYLRSLQLLMDTFVLSASLRDTLTPRDHHTLFSNVHRVQSVSERFLGVLLSRVRSSPHISDLCDVVHAHAEGPFSVYVDYVRNQQYQEETYRRLMETNMRFSAELHRLQSLPQCQKLPLPSFLLLPFQRITRLRMLLQNIFRQTEEGSSRRENAQRALGAISKIIERCSAEVGRMKQTEELIRLSQRLRFHKVKALPLVSWSRRLELQGELMELGSKKGRSLFNSRPRLTPLCLLLFSDLLLITQPKSGQRLHVLDYAHRSLVQAQPVPDPSGPPTFRLSLLSNHQGCPTHRLLQTSSLSDMQRWLGAFPIPGPPPCSPDTIYEEWDCPQALSADSHVIAKTKDLSLEPGDLVNKLHKGPEAWLKSIHGAYAAQLASEVTGEHIRRKNLRQQKQLLQETGNVQTTPPLSKGSQQPPALT